MARSETKLLSSKSLTKTHSQTQSTRRRYLHRLCPNRAFYATEKFYITWQKQNGPRSHEPGAGAAAAALPRICSGVGREGGTVPNGGSWPRMTPSGYCMLCTLKYVVGDSAAYSDIALAETLDTQPERGLVGNRVPGTG